MSNGDEEQKIFDGVKNGKLINWAINKLGLDNINNDVIEPVENGITSSSVRVRTNDTVPKSIMTSEEERPINNFYTSVPTFTINETPSNTSGNKAFAEVLIVAEILALIILVTLITLVAFYGLS